MCCECVCLVCVGVHVCREMVRCACEGWVLAIVLCVVGLLMFVWVWVWCVGVRFSVFEARVSG